MIRSDFSRSRALEVCVFFAGLGFGGYGDTRF